MWNLLLQRSLNTQAFPSSSDNFNNHNNSVNNSINNNINKKSMINDTDFDFDFAMCHGYSYCWRYRGYC